jgi:hypothetical protein
MSWSKENDVASKSLEAATEREFEPLRLILPNRLRDIRQLVAIAGYALKAMAGHSELAEVLYEAKEKVDLLRKVEALALAEAKADLPLLHSAATALVWGAMESAFRDFLVRWLLAHPTALQATELKNVRVRVAEYERLVGEDRMRFLVGVLERELAASLRPGVGRFECLLKPFGISPPVTDEDRRSLNELAAVRNAIVHRAGITDERLVELCPWMNLKIGDVISVSGSMFQRYFDVTSKYAISIVETAHKAMGDVGSQ